MAYGELSFPGSGCPVLNVGKIYLVKLLMHGILLLVKLLMHGILFLHLSICPRAFFPKHILNNLQWTSFISNLHIIFPTIFTLTLFDFEVTISPPNWVLLKKFNTCIDLDNISLIS